MELAILANNDTNTSADLANIQAEYDAMTAELSAILASTYKGADLFQSGMSVGVDGRTNTKSYGVASPTVSGMAQTLSTGSAATSALVTVQQRSILLDRLSVLTLPRWLLLLTT